MSAVRIGLLQSQVETVLGRREGLPDVDLQLPEAWGADRDEEGGDRLDTRAEIPKPLLHQIRARKAFVCAHGASIANRHAGPPTGPRPPFADGRMTPGSAFP